MKIMNKQYAGGPDCSKMKWGRIDPIRRQFIPWNPFYTYSYASAINIAYGTNSGLILLPTNGIENALNIYKRKG